MKIKPHIARPVALWSGATLLFFGLIVASVAIWGAVRSPDVSQNPETMAAELRAKGAIVENYYKVLGDRYQPLSSPPPPSSPDRITSYLAAGLLVSVGSILIWKALIQRDRQNVYEEKSKLESESVHR